jgi:hypothetical protein
VVHVTVPTARRDEAARRSFAVAGQDVVVYATTTDGVRWDKPALGLHSYDGSTANNIVFDVHSPAVVLDRFERDPAKRFQAARIFPTEITLRRIRPTASAGTRIRKPPCSRANDTMSMTQDPRTGEILVYFKKSAPNVPGRVVWLTRHS